MSIECVNISYKYDESCGGNVVDNVSLRIERGEVVGIMGPSGGGKTTLLGLLAGRLTPYEGQVTGHGLAAFLPQEDTLFPNISVRENLDFYARLRTSLSSYDRSCLVDETLESLGLTGCAERRPQFISGGERRRASIGKELIHSPQVAFLDEPTSGLDSESSREILLALRRMSRERGMTVIMTIHQPPDSLLVLMDKVMVLREGRIEHLTSFLKSFDDEGGDLECPHNMISRGRENTPLLHHDPRPPSWMWKFVTLMERGLKQHRGGVLTWMAAIETLCLIFMTFGIWGRGTGSQTNPEVDSKRSLLYYCITYVFYQTAFGALHSFQSERKLVRHEIQNGTYSLLSYVLARTISESVVDSVIPMCFAVSVYWTTGLRSSTTAFLLFLTVMLLVLLVGNSLGMLLSASTKDLREANLCCRLISSWSILLSGFFVTNENLGPLYHLRWTSPIKYGYEALLSNEVNETHEIETSIQRDLLSLLAFVIILRTLIFVKLRYFDNTRSC